MIRMMMHRAASSKHRGSCLPLLLPHSADRSSIDRLSLSAAVSFSQALGGRDLEGVDHGFLDQALANRVLTVPRSMAAITVTVDQGGAGFAANEDLSVKKVDPEGRCDEAGVTLDTCVLLGCCTTLHLNREWRHSVQYCGGFHSDTCNRCASDALNLRIRPVL